MCTLSATDGSFFSTHYHLGHRKFETGDPELFLFGELSDINFLNRKPVSVSEGGREREREREGGRAQSSQTKYKPHVHTHITVSL